jgi:plasmid stability protein
MPALVIKELPVEIHRRLKEDAEQHRRSMTQEAIAILEQGLHRVRPIPEFKPYKGSFPLTNAFINRAKKEGRP